MAQQVIMRQGIVAAQEFPEGAVAECADLDM